MSNRKTTDVNLKTISKEDAKQKDKKIREGQEDSSVWGDKDIGDLPGFSWFKNCFGKFVLYSQGMK